MRLFSNLTPFKHPEKSSIFLGTRLVPLSMIWIYIPIMRGEELKRGAIAPLRHPVSLASFKGEGEE